MQRYTDYVIDQNGNPVYTATIQVFLQGTQTPATLFNEEGGTTSRANPVTTDPLGQFWFYAADGRYDLQISGLNTATITVSDILLEDPQDGSTAVFSDLTVTGTLTLGTPLAVSGGGTGASSYTDGQLLIGNSGGGLTKATLTAGTAISVTNGNGSIAIANTAPDQTVAIASGTGISATGTYPNFTIANTAPDQVVSLTQGGTTTITGTYPNFTISSDDQFDGTVTSLDISGGTTGLTATEGPITSSGTITLGGTLAVANGGTGATTAADARTNLDVYSKGEVDNLITAANGNALAFAIALG